MIKLKIRKFRGRKWVIALIALFLLFLSIPLPDPLFDQPLATTIESPNGELFGALIADDGQWRFPETDSIPEIFEQSLLLFEDEYFYRHPGVNPVSIFKALLTNIEKGEIVRGGSTISMQVLRMARGNQPRTFLQKTLEIILALKLELLYSKEEILNMYVSHAPFGGNVVGLSAASWRYFGRSPDQLSWGEAASLAVLPNSPSLIFPGKNEEIFKKKRDFLLTKVYQRNLIDSLTWQLSMAEELPGTPMPLPRIAPRLLTRTLKDELKGKRNVVCIDKSLQQNITRLTQEHMKSWSANYVHNAAVLVVEIETGQAKAYVGNVKSEDIHGQSVDIITAPRSTGSLLKPFLYAAAIDDGLITPKQLLKDYPIFYEGFSPKNFDLKYRGAVHADEALTRSLNLPFVLLLREYGVEKFHQKLKRIGMNLREQPDHYGLSIVLGGSESSLWNLTNMYANLFRVYQNSLSLPVTRSYEGQNYFHHTYLANTPSKNFEKTPKNEFSIAGIWTTFEALKGLNRPEEFAGWEQFRSSTPIAWKTGTSFGFRDAWAIGINGKYIVGVWVGNADGEGRPGLVGGKAAAPLMFQTLELLESESFGDTPTQETSEFQICQESGQKANEYCPNVKATSLPMSSENSRKCEFHQLIHLDQNLEFQVNSSCYDVSKIKHAAWFTLPPVQAWYYRQFNPGYKSLPKYFAGCTNSSENTKLEMIYPRNHTEIFIPVEIDGTPGRSIFEAAHDDSNEVIHWHLDGEYLGSTKREHQMPISGQEGPHFLQLVDGEGNELEMTFTILSKAKTNKNSVRFKKPS